MSTYLIPSIINYIFDKEICNLNQRKYNFINENCRLGGSPDGFFHQGKLFSILHSSLVYNGRYEILQSALIPSVDAYLEDSRIVNFDRGAITQILSILIRHCEDPQDVRDALPNCLAPFDSYIEKLNRIRPEAYTLIDPNDELKTKQYKQYMKVREKILYYVALRLLN